MSRFGDEEKREDVLHNRIGLSFMEGKELEQVREKFKQLFKNGELDMSKFLKEMESFGLNTQGEEIQKLFDEVKEKGKLNKDFDEFMEFIEEFIFSCIEDRDTMCKIFLLYLGEEDVDKVEIRHLKKICPHISDEEYQEMFDFANNDNEENKAQNKVNLADFYNATLKKI